MVHRNKNEKNKDRDVEKRYFRKKRNVHWDVIRLYILGETLNAIRIRELNTCIQNVYRRWAKIIILYNYTWFKVK